MPRLLLLVVAALTVTSCGGKSSPAPAPTTNAWALSGTVSTAAGTAIVGATAKILDGPSANQSTTTSAAGRYSFANVIQSNLTIQISAEGYVAQSTLIALTRDSVVDFSLAKALRANLVGEGTTAGIKQADGSYDFPLVASNAGDACARDISGTTTFYNTTNPSIAVINWTLPAGTTVAPGQSFMYHACCLSSADAFASTTFSTRFTFVSSGTSACQ